MSLSEAVLLLAFGEATIEASPEARLSLDPTDGPEQRPEAWRVMIGALEEARVALSADEGVRLARLRKRLEAFDQTQRALRDAADILFSAHVDGRIVLSGFERVPRGNLSTIRRPIPPNYFADSREADWLASGIRPPLDGPDGQINFEQMRRDATWEVVSVRRAELLRLWDEAGTQLPSKEPNELATQSDPSGLPPWLTLPLAIGWVLYRTPAFALQFTSYAELSADAFYPQRPRIGSSADLQAALADGRLVARGALPNSAMQDIPAVEWTRLEVRPDYRGQRSPFSGIVIAAADLVRHFPSDPSAAASARRPVSDADLKRWYKSLGKGRESMRQIDLLAASRAAFPNNTIPRERIYQITGRRKRGPKRIP